MFPTTRRFPAASEAVAGRLSERAPSYAVVYEFENENVSQTAEWLEQRDIHPDNQRMRDTMTHAPGSPGIWKKTFQL